MKEFVTSYKRVFLGITAVVIIAALVAVTLLANSCQTGETDGAAATLSQVNPDIDQIAATTRTTTVAADSTQANTTAAPSTKASKNEKKESTAASTAPSSSEARDVPFATAIPPLNPASYYEQWDLGYLVAIDNPDRSYACSRVTLTEEDRDLLERLCYGEFGSGGFVGAALIAQAVKDAMCFDGYPTVASVIRECRYTGSTSIGTSDSCRQAVRYIFDDNRDAVQHRIMYMYNPYMVQSAFHESQNFILSYQGVRFFDRWGY